MGYTRRVHLAELVLHLLGLLEVHHGLVVVVLLPGLDGGGHVVHQLVAHVRVQVRQLVRLLKDAPPRRQCCPIL